MPASGAQKRSRWVSHCHLGAASAAWLPAGHLSALRVSTVAQLLQGNATKRTIFGLLDRVMRIVSYYDSLIVC